MSYTALQFLNQIKPMVLEDMRRSGILASLTAAQALIESKHGESGLAVKANNLFGIKGEYNGQSVTMMTTEYENHVAVRKPQKFRKYPSWQESINDHSAMFNRMKIYTNLRGATDYKTACKNVEKDGYATAEDPVTHQPNYANTLINTIITYHLYDWDNEVLGGTQSVPAPDPQLVNGNPYNEPTKNVKLNSKGNDVRWLQVQLNRLGYKLVVDGIAGLITVGAIMDFQKKHGLVPDGICGPDTRARLKTLS